MKSSNDPKALRKAKSLTQQALANQVAVHVTQVNRYEAGESQPTLEVVRNLAIALGVSADMQIFEQDERGPDEDLKLQFEAVSQFDDADKQLAQGVLEGLILKHQAKQSVLRQQAAVNKPPDTQRRRRN